MDSYDISEVKSSSHRKRPKGRVWNILTGITLIAILCIISAIVMIFINPNSFLNPFPPPTLNPALFTPTPTVTLRFTLVPSWTPTGTPIPFTETPVPSDTPVATIILIENPTPEQPTDTAPAPQYTFDLQQGSPSAIAGSDFHQTANCDWSGVAGQATSLNGEAVKGLFVQLGGSLPGGKAIDNLIMTGLAPEYGEGGFEITIADKPIATDGTLWIQLLDQQNLPLSNRIYFNTYDDCQRNLVIIYFNQVR